MSKTKTVYVISCAVHDEDIMYCVDVEFEYSVDTALRRVANLIKADLDDHDIQCGSPIDEAQIVGMAHGGTIRTDDGCVVSRSTDMDYEVCRGTDTLAYHINKMEVIMV